MPLTASEILRIKSNITRVLGANAAISPARVSTLLPIKNLQGKLYEADVIASICENLVTLEGCTLNFIGGTNLMLKQKGGPIDRNYPYFEVRRGASLIGELFTDLYFNTLSYQLRGGTPVTRSYGDYHELDIALVKPGLTGHPEHSDVLLAVECKNTSLEKSIIRELLGFRRELSYYSSAPYPTSFTTWPASQTNSNPNSVHMLYCSDIRVARYQANCLQFGILLQYHVM